MPIDSDGNRADIITGPDSVPGRSNLGRLHSPYFAAAARDVRKEMLEIVGYPRNFVKGMSLADLGRVDNAKLNYAVERLLKYYSIVSPITYKEFTETLTEEEKVTWLLNIFNGTLYTFMPVDDPKPLDEMILEIEQNFKLTYGPVTYVGHSGRQVTTKNSVRIAPIPIMLLDKIADSWLATSTGKHSNFGILTARVHADRYTRPWKSTPARVVGETEGRIYACYGGRLFVAELLDRNGNIASQREIAKNILHAEHPTNIPKLVSRQKIPFGNTRPLQIINQFFYTGGVKLVYTPEKVYPETEGEINHG